MIELLSKRTVSGDLFVNLAKHHLQLHEWGLARIAIENAIERGELSEPRRAHKLKRAIERSLGISLSRHSVDNPALANGYDSGGQRLETENH